jgi:hypothetical protein
MTATRRGLWRWTATAAGTTTDVFRKSRRESMCTGARYSTSGENATGMLEGVITDWLHETEVEHVHEV